MNFAEDIALILIVCAITYPLYALFFVLAHFYKKKTQRGSGCTVFLKATVIEPLRIRIKHSYHYFMIYQYEYMDCIYLKNTVYKDKGESMRDILLKLMLADLEPA